MEETLFPATGKEQNLEFHINTAYLHLQQPSLELTVKEEKIKRPYKQISLKNIIDETYQLRNIKPLHPIKKSVQ